MSRHTPGPWKLKVDQYNAHAIKGPDGRSVASVIQRRPEVGANARLIAAAPEMLIALNTVLNTLTSEKPYGAHELTLLVHLVEKVKAKAEGRS